MFHPRAFARALDDDDDDEVTTTMSKTTIGMKTRALVVGDERCGKTTLCVRFAARFALARPRARALILRRRNARDGEDVHLTEKEKMKANEALKRVFIKYVESDEDVRRWCAFRHCAPSETQPTLVVVDDLGSMVRETDRVRRELAYAKTLAVLHESARDDESGEATVLIVSERTERETGTAPMAYVYARWFEEVLHAHEDASTGKEGDWDLQASSDGASAKYSTRN